MKLTSQISRLYEFDGEHAVPLAIAQEAIDWFLAPTSQGVSRSLGENSACVSQKLAQQGSVTRARSGSH